MLSPTVSNTRLTIPTATESKGLFSVNICEMKLGAAVAKKIRLPRHAAPLYVNVPVALIKAATPYVWIALPARELPQAAAAPAASRDLTNSPLEFEACAAWYVSPKTGARMPREAVWVNIVPRAMAEGFTGGRSIVSRQLCIVRLQ